MTYTCLLWWVIDYICEHFYRPTEILIGQLSQCHVQRKSEWSECGGYRTLSPSSGHISSLLRVLCRWPWCWIVSSQFRGCVKIYVFLCRDSSEQGFIRLNSHVIKIIIEWTDHLDVGCKMSMKLQHYVYILLFNGKCLMNYESIHIISLLGPLMPLCQSRSTVPTLTEWRQLSQHILNENIHIQYHRR